MKLGVSTWNYLCESEEKADIRRIAIEAAADHFGVEIWLEWEPHRKAVASPTAHLKELLEQTPWVSLHTGLWQYDAEAVRQEIDICAHLGGNVVVAHEGTFGINKDTTDFEHIAPLAQYAQHKGIYLALENGDFNILTRVVNEVDVFSPCGGLGICIDVGHANLCKHEFKSPIEKFLDEFHSRLVHLHLADNFGENDDHLVPGKGTIDWKKLLSKLQQLDFQGSATLEIESHWALQEARESRQFLQGFPL